MLSKHEIYSHKGDTMSKAYDYDWKTLIEEQQTSGMNMKLFCKEKGLPYQTFKNHKYSLQSQSSTKSSFLPVMGEVPKEVRFTLNANTIRFNSSLDDDSISRILKALTS